MKILFTRSKDSHLVRSSCLGIFSTFVFSLTASAVQPLSDSQLQSKDISIVPKTLASKKRTEACNAETFTSSKSKKSKSTCSDTSAQDDSNDESSVAASDTAQDAETTKDADTQNGVGNNDGDDTSNLSVLSDSMSNDAAASVSDSDDQFDDAMQALGLDNQPGAGAGAGAGAGVTGAAVGVDDAEKLAKQGFVAGLNNSASQFGTNSMLSQSGDIQKIGLDDLKLLGLNLSSGNLNLSGLLALNSDSVNSVLLNSALSFQNEETVGKSGTISGFLTSVFDKITVDRQSRNALLSKIAASDLEVTNGIIKFTFKDDLNTSLYIYGSITGDLYEGLDFEIPSITTGIRSVEISGFQRPSLR